MSYSIQKILVRLLVVPTFHLNHFYLLDGDKHLIQMNIFLNLISLKLGISAYHGLSTLLAL